MSIRQETGSRILEPVACGGLAATTENFDFARFFATFPLDSPVSKFVESFSISSFRNIMVQVTTQSSLSAQFGARCELEGMLTGLDSVLRAMEEARLEVQGVRDTLAWMMTENRRAMKHGDLRSSILPPSAASARTAASSRRSEHDAGTLRSGSGAVNQNLLSAWEHYSQNHRSHDVPSDIVPNQPSLISLPMHTVITNGYYPSLNEDIEDEELIIDMYS